MLTFTIPFVIVYIYSQNSLINISKYIIWGIRLKFSSFIIFITQIQFSILKLSIYVGWIFHDRPLYIRGVIQKRNRNCSCIFSTVHNDELNFSANTPSFMPVI